MEDSSVPDMLRILNQDSSALNQMHRNISNGLNRLQINAEIFMRTLEKLGFTQLISPNKRGASWYLEIDLHTTVEEDEDFSESTDICEVGQQEINQCIKGPDDHEEEGDSASSCERKEE